MSDKEVVAFRSGPADLYEWQPDIVVGVDFGMTYTGVAYSYAPGWQPPKTIQRWPGKLLGELANKVPTCIEYEVDSPTTVKSWGFLCDQEDQSSVIHEFFKLHLAPQYREESGSGPSRIEAQRWFRDYVQCVYQHIMNYLASTIPEFPLKNVEILFSVPTTWKDVRMIEETRALIEQAIMTRSSNHQAAIGLTEAEAAAVYACNQHYQMGDTIMVCDAGGGTTDVNVLKLLSSTGQPTVLKQLGNVEGRPIGSVFIDRAIHQLLCERLSKISHHLTKSPTEIAWKMIAGRFQRLKCSFGTDATSLTPWLKLDVPSLGPGSDFPEAEIHNGQMQISWGVLEQAFDNKIDEMCDLLDGQFEQTATKYPDEKISYIVLSGGFGSSPYVIKRLLDRYSSVQTGMQVLIADEPQLVVVHGLVLDRIQQIQRGVVVFGSRCSPVSYGIICDEVYDPAKHLGEPVRQDPRDNKTYAIRQIDWLVTQGKPIPHTGITKEFQLKMEFDENNQVYKVHIVMSTLPPESLPRSINNGGAQEVCRLDIPTGFVDKKLKNRHWYNFKPTYWRTRFDVKVVVGAADLKFQLWNKETRIRSREHEPIRVKWEPARELNEVTVCRLKILPRFLEPALDYDSTQSAVATFYHRADMMMTNKKRRLMGHVRYRRLHDIGRPVVNISNTFNQNIVLERPKITHVTPIDLTVDEGDGYLSSDTEAGSISDLENPEEKEDEQDSEDTRFNEDDYLNDEQLHDLLRAGSDDPAIGAQIDHPTTVCLQEYRGLKPGTAVKLTNNDLMRVDKIFRLFNGDVFLRGLYFKQLMNLPTPFPQKHRELCWIIQQDASGAVQLQKDVAISAVQEISRIVLTNQRWYNSNLASLPYIQYICRLAWQETAQKGETIIRYLSFEESDADFKVPEHIIRQQWRGETGPFGSETVERPNESRKEKSSLKMRRKYSFGDAFCGAGGVSVGAFLAGLRVKYGVDMDEAACLTWRTNFVHSDCYHADFNDWYALHGADEMRVDVSHSSPPCQPFSPAHTRSYNIERDEANSSLIFSAFNMISKVRPRIHTIEETFGVASRHKETLDRMLQDILEHGYSIHSRIVSCQNYGIPQARKRLFIIAAGPGEKLPTFPEPTHGEGLKPYFTIKDALARIPRGVDNHDLEYTAFADGITKVPYDANTLAKTITCGGGEKNYHPSGLRHYTIRELASLQTFPWQYKFLSRYAKKQIGNSVPPRLAEAIYRAVIKSLQETDERELYDQGIVID